MRPRRLDHQLLAASFEDPPTTTTNPQPSAERQRTRARQPPSSPNKPPRQRLRGEDSRTARAPHDGPELFSSVASPFPGSSFEGPDSGSMAAPPPGQARYAELGNPWSTAPPGPRAPLGGPATFSAAAAPSPPPPPRPGPPGPSMHSAAAAAAAPPQGRQQPRPHSFPSATTTAPTGAPTGSAGTMQLALEAPIALVFMILHLSEAEVIEWIQASVGKLNYIAG